jgi:hypothetical protein
MGGLPFITGVGIGTGASVPAFTVCVAFLLGMVRVRFLQVL